MKKIFLFVIILLFSSQIYAKENTDSSSGTESKSESTLPQFFKSFTECNYIFDWGVSYAQLTRIELMNDRSNFVRENMMIGAYFTAETSELGFFDLLFSLSIYYPFYQAFNGMEQKAKNLFNYAVDTYFGTIVTYDKLDYVILNFTLGMHYMYQLTDEYHMNYLGIGGSIGIDFPISKSWTIVETNFFSYDNPNLGANKKIQPFDSAYQFHINLGVRYSGKVLNKYSYIKQFLNFYNELQQEAVFYIIESLWQKFK